MNKYLKIKFINFCDIDERGFVITYDVRTCRFLMSFAISNKSLVERMFMLTASRKGESKRTVAATWKTILTSSCKIPRSVSDIPKFGFKQSPLIGATLVR